MSYALLLEDGTSYLLLEDGTSRLLLEDGYWTGAILSSVGANPTQVTDTLPASVDANSLLFQAAYGFAGGQDASLTVTDSASATWSKVETYANYAGDTLKKQSVSGHYKFVSSALTSSLTTTTSMTPTYSAIYAQSAVFPNIDTATGLVAYGAANAGDPAGSLTSLSVTTSTNVARSPAVGDLVISVLTAESYSGGSASVTFSVSGTGWTVVPVRTNDTASPPRAAWAWRYATASGAQTADWTFTDTGSGISGAVVLVFPARIATGTFAVTEGADSAGLGASIVGTGTFAVTEGADTASLSASIVGTGTFAVTEGSDAASLSASIVGTGTFAVTEGADSAVLSGTATSPTATGTFAVIEGTDSASLSGAALTVGTFSITEGADSASTSGTVAWVATLAATEGADSASTSGTVAWVATLAATEGADSPSLSGSVVITATLAVTEGADTAVLAGSLSIDGAFAVTEGTDAAALAGALVTTGTLAVTEGADTAALVGSLPTTGTFAVTEGADVSTLSGLYLTQTQLLQQVQKLALTIPPPPNLPLAPRDWDARFQEQFANVLRLYFNGLSGALQQLAQPSGGRYLSTPYGAFHDTTTQTAADTVTAYPITLAGTDLSNTIALSNGSRIVVAAPAVYRLHVEIGLANYDAAAQDIDVWLRRNGTDVAFTRRRVGLAPRKGVGDPYHTLDSMSALLALNADDYVQIVWCTTSVNAYIEGYTAGGTPTRPAAPSVLAMMTCVSSST